MIIIGYQGIGKSTLAATDNNYIDLESSHFWLWDDKTEQLLRPAGWERIYTSIAEDLSAQGYNVFTSSHEIVRTALAHSKEKVIVVYPAPALKDEWIEKLEKRYESSKTLKDYKALMNAKDRYLENIEEIKNSGFETREINGMVYDLKEIIEK